MSKLYEKYLKHRSRDKLYVQGLRLVFKDAFKDKYKKLVSRKCLKKIFKFKFYVYSVRMKLEENFRVKI
jgi:hypothetical protein